MCGGSYFQFDEYKIDLYVGFHGGSITITKGGEKVAEITDKSTDEKVVVCR